jgi:arginase
MKPLVRSDDVTTFGTVEYLAVPGVPFDNQSLARVRQQGISAAVDQTIRRFKDNGVKGFWIHLDADVLNDALMPAVDSRHEDGMSWDELGQTLRGLLSSNLAVGLEVTIYDPDLDPTGQIGRRFTQAIAEALRATIAGG